MQSESLTHPSSEADSVHYECLGAGGPVLVLLHGWGRSLDALRPLGELLAENFRVILIDLPGFGRSALPAGASNEGGGWDTVQYATRVKEVLESLSVSQCILVGHSFGGRVSVRLAAMAPELVQGVVLIGAPGVPYQRPLKQEIRSRGIKAAVNLAKKVDALIGTRFFAHYLAPRFGSRDYQAAGDLRKTFVKTVSEDLTVDARAIKAPALLLWGELDFEAPVGIAQRYKQLISESELIVLPRRGHEPFADVGSHLIASYIGRFVSRIGAARAH
jgi:pimeloyl-ACP methyl ester carboxylesterase